MKVDKHPNIILIVIDALRARNLGCYGMSGNPSPNIDYLARKGGVLFDNTYASWNTTDQSLTSILTGKYPRSHGIMNHGDKVTLEDRQRFRDTNTKLLAQILQKSQYKTMAVDWMRRWFVNGFDYYGYDIERNVFENLKYYLYDIPRLYGKYMSGHLPILKCYTPVRKPTIKDMVKGMKDVLSTFAFTFNLAKLQDAEFVTRVANGLINQNRHEPFFLFLHYWDTHTPYHCPNEYIKDKQNLKDTKDLLNAKYHGAVKYVDFQLGKLFEVLKENNIWDDTLLIVTSDHGDSLTEHGIFFDHHGLYEETTHVPLLLHWPRMFSKGKKIKGFVQHIDIVPTICDILGIDGKSYNFDGKSLMPLINGEIDAIRDHVFMEESYVQKKMSLRNNRYKYISALDNDGWCNYCQKVHVGKEELYDLNRDPRENDDIATQNESIAKEMNNRLKKVVENLDRKRDALVSNNNIRDDHTDENTPQEEEKIAKRMRYLGYFTI